MTLSKAELRALRAKLRQAPEGFLECIAGKRHDLPFGGAVRHKERHDGVDTIRAVQHCTRCATVRVDLLVANTHQLIHRSYQHLDEYKQWLDLLYGTGTEALRAIWARHPENEHR